MSPGTDSTVEGSAIGLPKGGGAVSGLGETFTADLFTGTGHVTVPIAIPDGRLGLQPRLSLDYHTGTGNGPYGLGWQLSLPGVSRKTSKGIPRYVDAPDPAVPRSDVFVLAGAEDLVPVAGRYPGRVRYRPRTEGMFARIEHVRDASGDYWEVRTKDGRLTRYGTARPADADDSWRDPATVTDPDDVTRIFGWRITATQDPMGNLVRYEYRTDQGQEGGRRWNQPLPSRISYVDYGDRAQPSFLVDVDFEYDRRPDPFSDYRAGFEVRTSLRCHTVRVSTHAADGVARVTREYHLSYQQAAFNGASLLTRVDVIGIDDTNPEQSPATEQLPPVTFRYTAFDPAGRRFGTVTGPGLPAATLGRPTLALVDTRGVGLPDLVELGATARVWANAGAGRFELPRSLGDAPPFALGSPGVHLLDADGDGRPDLLVSSLTPDGRTAGAGVAGYFPMTFAGGWSRRSFRSYRRSPSVALANTAAPDANVKLLDLDGDGLTDVLRSGTRLEGWFNDPDPALAWQRTAVSDATGPRVDLADPRVRLADMTGDGLQDIVLVRNGNIAYWPNLGHNRWGAPVPMRRSPRLPDGYDPRRVLLGDVDGDGGADLVYVDHGQVQVWGNQSGNGWTETPLTITGTPRVADRDLLQLSDLHGTGMAGLLLSRTVDGSGGGYLRFLDFTGGVKPYLLEVMDNRLGATTRVSYTSSTQEYLRDRAHPATRWRTTLPFPVQVVSRVEMVDAISGGRLVSGYRYHHGYWDGVEREFRGFAMVEQLDTETFAAGGVGPDHFGPPTLTRSWFHPGPVAAAEAGDWSELDLRHEYSTVDAPMLARPAGLSAFLAGLPRSARRAALRTLRGQLVRTELYALDGSDREDRPYSVTEAICGVREESPPLPGSGRERIFFPFGLATRSTEWERGSDPLTRFSFPAGYDAYGFATGHLAVAVPRGRDPLAPATTAPAYLATYATTEYAHRDDDTHYLVDRVARTTSYEVVNDGRRPVPDLADAVLSGLLDDSGVSLTVIGHTRTFYDGDPFIGLAVGEIGAYGLATRAESLAFSDDFLDRLYAPDDPLAISGRPVYLAPDGVRRWPAEYPPEFRDRQPALAGYRHYRDGEVPGSPGGYFVMTSRHRYDVHDPARVPRGLPLATLDAFGGRSRVEYDQHDLLPVRTVDPVGLETRADNDYRVLGPHTATDINGNTHSMTFSPAGLVTAQFVRGRDGEGDRDTPSTTTTYDLLAYDQRGEPVSVRTERRVRHDGDSEPDTDREVLVSVEYSDGFGRVVQVRSPAEDILFGDATFGAGVIPVDQSVPVGDTVGRTRAPGDPDNVIVSGWQVYDNKGRVVHEYEPFFSTGLAYAAPVEAQFGQRSTTFYDPRGTAVRTVSPDGSERRVVLGIPADLTEPAVYHPTPWESYTYDGNDNAGRTHPDRAQPYAEHWNTPSSTEVDALGRAVRTVARNGPNAADWFTSTSTYDIHGNLITVTDPLGRVAFRYTFDLAANRWRVDSIDAGRRDTVADALGQVVETRDGRGSLTLGLLDAVHRPVRVWARDEKGGPVTLRQRIEYGDAGTPDQPPTDRAAARAGNLLGHPVRHYDGAGLLSTDAVDFKGNLLQSTRYVIADAPVLATYDRARTNGWQVAAFQVDWTPGAGQSRAQREAELLEPTGYVTNTTFDALNRIVSHTFPADVQGRRRVLRPSYNRAGELDQLRLDDLTPVRRLAYDAKGQRAMVAYGNGLLTRYAYDPRTFQLARMRTESYRTNDDLTYQPTGTVVQDYAYDRDLVGNVLSIRDTTRGSGIPGSPAALGSVGTTLGARLASGDALERRFTYDPTYRLLSATGREHQAPPPGDPWLDHPRGVDLSQVQAYQERYRYDAVGSLVQLVHAGPGGFTRDFTVAADSNRLRRLTTGTTPVDYAYDAAGNLVAEAGTRRFGWNHGDQLATFSTQTAGAEPSVHAHYLYDHAGRRVKKLVRRQGGAVEVTHYPDETFEHHRWTGKAAGANNHVHVMDDTQRVALIRSGPAHPDAGGPVTAVHLADHLGSSVAVVDDTGALINREEYTPYGETSFGSYARKRYRFTGRERDEESGLSLHGHRYALLWLGRWSSCDPIGQSGGLNQYLYAAGNPIGLRDAGGTQPKPASQKQEGNILAPAIGAAIAHANPTGKTLAVPNNYDNAKIKAIKQRINDPTDRAVGIRSTPPGAKSATADLRAATLRQRNAYQSTLENGALPAGMTVDHTVELQHIIRRRPGVFAPGADRVRDRDHRLQPKSLNSSQGKSGELLNKRQLRAGAPLDTPAGGVSRVKDLNRFYHREGFRTGMRAFGTYNLAGGTYQSLKDVGASIREGNATGAALSTSAYLGGAFTLGGIAAKSATLLNAGRVLGAPAAVVGAGLLGVRIGTELYDNHVNKQGSLAAGSWIEDKTGSAVFGGAVASGYAIGSAAYHAPGAAVDYAKDNLTLDPGQVDWDRTLKPWKW